MRRSTGAQSAAVWHISPGTACSAERMLSYDQQHYKPNTCRPHAANLQVSVVGQSCPERSPSTCKCMTQHRLGLCRAPHTGRGDLPQVLLLPLDTHPINPLPLLPCEKANPTAHHVNAHSLSRSNILTRSEMTSDMNCLPIHGCIAILDTYMISVIFLSSTAEPSGASGKAQ
jgi:hypothetical protein